MDLLADLDRRGLIHDSTDRAALSARLSSGPMGVYVGFDPTADSLHVGHLVGQLYLRRFQMAGHKPFPLAGGATGMVGDPSGRSDERNLLDVETLRFNVSKIEAQLQRLLDFSPGRYQATLVNNADWTEPVTLLDFLRDVGKFVTVNQMLAKDSVRSRLDIPVNTPVRFVMTSTDVLHAFYIPVMRIKQDIIPRRYTYAWLNAQKPGTYRLNCAEYCGTDHSQMGRTGPILPAWPEGRRAVVVVHDAGGYERYLADKNADQNKMAPVDLGKLLYDKKGCVTCHSVDGTAKIGPTWKNPDWGKMIPLSDGTTVKMDENYLRESINVPSAKIHQGYANQMPAFEGQLKDVELNGLIAYIKSLKQ